ncbi:MAG: AAA family ATPase, partial [Lentisphaeria bacterium]|nr:AAA family ATPase [Lentisphaeria bacterium]
MKKDITSSVYSFEDLIQGNFLYVDKTEYIWQLIRPAKGMYFLSRPRRFGKSLTLSTLKTVFEGKKELFQGLAIYDKPYDWKKYPVIHLDMNGRDFSTLEKMEERFQQILIEQASINNVDLQISASDTMFHSLIKALHDRDGDVVVLLDEYDKPILNNITGENRSDFLNALRTFYSVIKEKNDMLRFVFITGVSKFCHVSLFSDLNNLTDITMDARYAEMFGYTQEELEANFGDRIAALTCDTDITAYKAKIKEWYNGYRFHKSAKTVYNPVSLAKFFESGGEFNNYWFSTGTPAFLMELTKKTDFDFRSVIGGDSVPEIAFSAFEIDNIDPLTLLLQTGYVTIKETEERFGQTWYFLDFPNREVAGAFSAYILNSYAGKTQTASVQFTAEIATALLNRDLKKLRKIMEVFFAGIPYTSHKKQESTFQTIFFSIFRLLGLYIEAESATND